jgi:hypothetical protein
MDCPRIDVLIIRERCQENLGHRVDFQLRSVLGCDWKIPSEWRCTLSKVFAPKLIDRFDAVI